MSIFVRNLPANTNLYAKQMIFITDYIFSALLLPKITINEIPKP